MSGTSERIKDLLGMGLSQHQVSQVTGVEESYVSGLMSDADFREAVHEERIKRSTNATKVDSLIDQGEEKALKKLVDGLNFPQKQGDILRTFQVLNNAKRKVGTVAPESAVGSDGRAVVSVRLPQVAQLFIRMSNRSEILEIDGRSMAAMPGKNVERMLQERQSVELLSEAVTEIKTTPLLEHLFAGDGVDKRN